MQLVAELGLPLIVKPAREGSTIGITKVSAVDHDEMRLAFEAAAIHDTLVLVEEFVSGVELTASIVNGRALPLIRIEAPQGNYDYHNKYFSDETKYFCPSGIADAKEQEIRDAGACRVRHRRLLRLGPARPDPARRRQLFVPGSEHVTRHDGPQPGADGGKTGGDAVSRSLRRDPAGCACGMTRRQLNAIAVTLTVIAAAFLSWAVVGWATRLSAFDYRDVVVTTPLARASGAHLETVIRSELRGTFFTMDLDAARAALAARALGARRRPAPPVAAQTRDRSRRARAACALERQRAREHAWRSVRRELGRRTAANSTGRTVSPA